MTQDEYEARILFERWQARVWLAGKLLEARRRYWTPTDDPIQLEDAGRRDALLRDAGRGLMKALNPAALVPIVTVAE